MDELTNVDFQALELSECFKLVPLINQLGYKLSAQMIENNVTQIRDRGGQVFVASYDTEIIGCIAAIIDVRLAAGKQGEIVTLVVLDRYRHMGVGSKLVTCAEQWLLPEVSSIRVRANVIRENAHQFYIYMGYKGSKTQKIFSKKLVY